MNAIDRAREKHPQAVPWLDAWVQIATEARWRSIVNLRNSFPSADGVRLKGGVIVTVFNVAGNKCRLLATISYALQVITVVDLLTHAEYDKGKWKDRI